MSACAENINGEVSLCEATNSCNMFMRAFLSDRRMFFFFFAALKLELASAGVHLVALETKSPLVNATIMI